MKGNNLFQKKLSDFFLHSSSNDENKELLNELNDSEEKLRTARGWFYGIAKYLGVSASQKWIDKNYQETMKRIRIKKMRHESLRAAASILLIISFGTVLHMTDLFKTSPTWTKIVVERGEQKKIVLADGTSVHLAPSSVFEYPNFFNSDARKVKLNGEAFFEVKSNETTPFIVNTARSSVVVKGTSFNIMAYDEDLSESTLLIEGKVSISLRDEDGDLIHKGYNPQPFQKISLDKKTNSTQISRIPSSFKPGWMDGRISFHNEPFSKLSKRLERFHNINIEIENTEISQTKLTGEFENESIFEIMDALNIILPFEYHFNKQTKTIRISALPENVTGQ